MTPTACCDFHDDPREIAEHIARQREEYERMSLENPAPDGWKIVPFGDPIPFEHRILDCMAYNGPEWHRPNLGRSTMHPLWATRAGWMGLFAARDSS